jgi:predicted glycogen debranching enzyme
VELVLAADQFIISPAGRWEGSARARAGGEEVCSVIAGYPWFTDWGRDTMISLEGLALVTGRQDEARRILRSFASYQKDGLIPNLFPEGDDEGLYHTADASLWFIHAVGRYLESTGDRATLRAVLPQLREIVERHLTGTRFGIGMDHGDGLLRQGAPGYQLTWMDAKVGDWVVTPRRGKAVEINALWYNALRLLAKWCSEEGDGEFARRLEPWADRAYRSFNERFWYAEGGYLYDVVDGETGDDPSCRPNQIFAIALPYPVLRPERWDPVLAVVRERLLTRVGLRTLSPGDPDYQRTYHGDLRARDAAYHQGTVWPWLIGPWVDAWLARYPEQKGTARGLLEGLLEELNGQCIGTIGEIYDAEEPQVPRGCMSQAWSVAEVLRCWVKTMSHGGTEKI